MKKTYPPINVINDINKNYPNIWNYYDEKRLEYDANKSAAIVIHKFSVPRLHSTTYSIYRLMTFGEWRKSKDVFTFPGRFWAIAQNVKDFNISNIFFKNLIGEVFYIDFERFIPKIPKVRYDTAEHILLIMLVILAPQFLFYIIFRKFNVNKLNFVILWCFSDCFFIVYRSRLDITH